MQSMQFGLTQKGVLLVAVPLVFELVFVSSLWSLKHAAETAKQREHHPNEILAQLGFISDCLVQELFAYGDAGIAGSESAKASLDRLAADRQTAVTKLEALIEDNPTELESLQSLRGASNELWSLSNSILTKYNDAPTTLAAFSYQISLYHRFVKHFKITNSAMSHIRDIEISREAVASIDETSAQHWADVCLWLGAVGNVIACIGLGIFFGRDIRDRLSSIVDNTLRLKMGHPLRARLTGSDEIAQLDAYFHQMADHFKAVDERRQVLDKLKRDFTNMITHDLRAPLASASIYMENLRSGSYGKLSEKGEESALRQVHSFKQLVTMINELLDIEKIESGRMTLSPEPVAAHCVVDAAFDSLRSLAEGASVDVHISCPVEIFVLADRERLIQVVQNLVSNAIKFSPAQSTVSISCLSKDGQAEFRVADNGPGISPDRHTVLFDRFQQLDKSRQSMMPGTGLGLSICKAIVEQLGGTIGVMSEEGHGSCFWLKIPLAHPEGPMVGSEAAVCDSHPTSIKS
jgi:signal transduction histidine kinase